MTNLQRETEAARLLIENYKAVIADDEDARLDLIEGETSLLEAIDAMLARMTELMGYEDGIDAAIDDLKSRKARFATQQDRIRGLLQHAMMVADLRKVERPIGTVSLRAVAPQLVVTEEADIPVEYWTPAEPKLNKRRLLAALKDGDQVPGCELSNGGETVSMRFK